VGSHTADHLLSRGDSVIIVDEMNDYYDVNLKRANLELLVEKYGTERLKIVEVSNSSRGGGGGREGGIESGGGGGSGGGASFLTFPHLSLVY